MPGAVESEIWSSSEARDDARKTLLFFPNVQNPSLLNALSCVVTPVAFLLKIVRQLTWDTIERGGQRVVWAGLDKRMENGGYLHNFGQIDAFINPLALNETLVAELVAITNKFAQLEE